MSVPKDNSLLSSPTCCRLLAISRFPATVNVLAISTAPSISTTSKFAVPLTSILPSRSMSPPTVKSSVIKASSVENKCSALIIAEDVMSPTTFKCPLELILPLKTDSEVEWTIFLAWLFINISPVPLNIWLLVPSWNISKSAPSPA